jgi:hypothetical protein
MASFNVSVPHELGQESALARVTIFLEQVRRDHADRVSDVRGEWQGHLLEFTFTASGIPVSGNLIVEEQTVRVSGPLSFMAAMFRGRIEQTIREELQKLLS